MLKYEDKYYIIDTDIGDDIDDGMAIGMALKIPGFNLIGITTVFKNASLRARLARKVLIDCKRCEIPVFAGAGNGLVELHNTQDVFSQYTEDLYEDEYDYHHDMTASDFIVDCARKYKEKLVIVAIGAMTNIALAINEDCKAMESIGGICFMGGSFYMHCNEWNIKCDPEAAKIMFNSRVKKRAAGLDVTLKTLLSEEEYRKVLDFKSETGIEIKRLAELWRNGSGSLPYLHDAVALYTSLFEYDEEEYNSVLHYGMIDADVSLEGITRGTTFNITTDNWHGGKGVGNIKIADRINADMFKKFFFCTIDA